MASWLTFCCSFCQFANSLSHSVVFMVTFFFYKPTKKCQRKIMICNLRDQTNVCLVKANGRQARNVGWWGYACWWGDIASFAKQVSGSLIHHTELEQIKVFNYSNFQFFEFSIFQIFIFSYFFFTQLLIHPSAPMDSAGLQSLMSHTHPMSSTRMRIRKSQLLPTAFPRLHRNTASPKNLKASRVRPAWTKRLIRLKTSPRLNFEMKSSSKIESEKRVKNFI